MELRDLEIFSRVYQLKSIQKSARSLNYVPSNISARIKILEKELKKDLFIRSSRGLIPTEYADHLYEHAQNMLQYKSKIEEIFNNHGNIHKKVTLGSMESTAAVHLGKKIVQIHRKYPQVDLELVTGTSMELYQKVLDYELDAAFIALSPQLASLDHSLTRMPAFAEKMVLLNQEKEIGNSSHLIGFRKGCSYRSSLEEWCREKKIQILSIKEFGSLQTILYCVSAGMGTAMLPLSVVKELGFENKLHIIYPDKKWSTNTTYLIYRKDQNIPFLIKEFFTA